MFINNPSSIFWDVTLVVAPTLIGIGWNFYSIRSDRRRNQVRRLELAARTERRAREQEYRDKVDNHERLLQYLDKKGLFQGNRRTQSGGIDFDFDS